MSIDAHVPSRTAERLAFSVRDVLFRLGITVLLRHSKVDNMNDCVRNVGQLSVMTLPKAASYYLPLWSQDGR